MGNSIPLLKALVEVCLNKINNDLVLCAVKHHIADIFLYLFYC